MRGLQPLLAALARPGKSAGTWLSYVLILVCCALTLFEAWLPMRELPQYAAMARMLVHLNDPSYGYATYYELDLWRGVSVLPLWLWGWSADIVGLPLANKLFACASVLVGQLGVCAVLRAQRKPVLLSLLGLPFIYGSTFYYGLIPSSLSLGMAFWAIAWLIRLPEAPHARYWLFFISVALPLTHPFGMGLVLLYVACLLFARRRTLSAQWVVLAPLSPLLVGVLYWGRAAFHADGVAAFQSPGLALRLLRSPDVLLGGFKGPGEAWLLVASLVLWVYLCRPVFARPFPRCMRTQLMAASWSFALVCLLGYLFLPGSTWTTAPIFPRVGGALLAWLPVLVPRAGLRVSRQRGPLLLVALAASSLCYSAAQLTRFSAEASALEPVLAAVPARAKLLALTYDNQGQLSRSSPYLHVGAYAQAERGGFLSLSRLDYAWTVPLRRRKDAGIPPPGYGSEWDPALLHHDFGLLAFYDTVLVIGKEPREMTILMNTPFRLVARSGMFMLYTRRPA